MTVVAEQEQGVTGRYENATEVFGYGRTANWALVEKKPATMGSNLPHLKMS
jgi:hypothetical protein